MDFTASTKILYERIQSIEPDLVSKIIGYLLLQADGEKQMMQFAFGPDQLIHALVAKAKLHLLSPKPLIPVPIPPTALNLPPNSDLPIHHFTPFSQASSRPGALHVPSSYWDPLVSDQPLNNMDLLSPPYSDPVSDDYRYFNHPQFLGMEGHFEANAAVNPSAHDFANNSFYSDAIWARSNRRSPTFPEFPLKPCHYWNQGHCKNGSNCRYLHSHPMTDTFPQIISPSSNDLSNDDHFLPGSLEQLELELTDLLKSRRGYPVSIASLPLLYQEKYGRTLQAEGYLTESQRHGKAGYSLTKLLARLKNSIRLIDRPHGQHAVVLAEDAPRYMEYRSERSDPGGVVAGSRQIYLTFPAESTFTEEDVSNYFSNFGPVQDVRIPCQQKRMFGFVTFLYPETVKMILAKGNPHFVCGARVLVKPYREKSRIVDRKYMEKSETPLYYPSHFLDMDAELQLAPRNLDMSRLLRKHFMDDHEQALELEALRLSELQLAPRQLSRQPYLGYSVDDFKDSEGCKDYSNAPATDRVNYLFDVFSNGPFNDEKGRHSSINSYTDQDSNQGLNLPESPFASPIGSGIST